MQKKIKTKKTLINNSIYLLEVVFAFVIIFVVAISFFSILPSLFASNWSDLQTFQDFLTTVLILVLGLELSKLLITSDIYAIGTLLTYVVARKALKPEITSLDLLTIVVSFAILFMLHVKFLSKRNSE